MSIDIQIKTFLYSLIFGAIVYHVIKLINVFNIKNKIINMVLSFTFFISLAFLYYITLYKINYGELSIYHFLAIISGISLCHLLYL